MKSKFSKKILAALQGYPPFYRKVWLACSQIPKGTTLSYGELAAKVGSPKAARAVGQAMAKNPFAPVIPCHRVIGSNGKMVGYSGIGGIKKKIAMLKKEQI
jgi:methylated-DNA-[protein]-cysteine S-methyltransferase